MYYVRTWVNILVLYIVNKVRYSSDQYYSTYRQRIIEIVIFHQQRAITHDGIMPYTGLPIT